MDDEPDDLFGDLKFIAAVLVIAWGFEFAGFLVYLEERDIVERQQRFELRQKQQRENRL